MEVFDMKSNMKWASLILAMLFLVLSACSNTTSGNESGNEAGNEGSSEGKYTIAFSVKTLTNEPFQSAIAESIQQTVEAAGHEFTLVTAGGQTAISTQVNQIEDLISSEVDAIILNPMDSKAVIPVLKKAKESGIPVILVDTPIDQGNEDLYVTYIGTDNFNAGVLAGQKMVEVLGGKGEVLIVRGANGNMAGDQRVDGFKKGLEGSDVTVASEQVGNWSNDVAMQATENMLQAHSDIQGIFSASDVMLDGILQALKDNEKTDVAIMSVDGSMKGVEFVEQGKITGTMAQFPAMMGESAAEYLIQILDGSLDVSTLEKNIDSGTKVFDSSNLEEALEAAF
jgi:ribose transport system substrate-binding protein